VKAPPRKGGPGPHATRPSARWKGLTMARELFFYNANTGSCATGQLDSDGNFTGLTTGGGLSTGWSHVNAVE
jgi:hypothetical protein